MIVYAVKLYNETGDLTRQILCESIGLALNEAATLRSKSGETWVQVPDVLGPVTHAWCESDDWAPKKVEVERIAVEEDLRPRGPKGPFNDAELAKFKQLCLRRGDKEVDKVLLDSVGLLVRELERLRMAMDIAMGFCTERDHDRKKMWETPEAVLSDCIDSSLYAARRQGFAEAKYVLLGLVSTEIQRIKYTTHVDGLGMGFSALEQVLTEIAEKFAEKAIDE
jgi:hypothetical protein